MEVVNRCAICQELSDYVYCANCADGDAKCAHGQKIGECDACDFEGDMAFDANREKGRR